MADFYCDPTALGASVYQAYADTPTSWAVPQDATGKGATASSAAVPLCELTFAAVPTSGAISVMGVSVTLTSVLSAGSTAAAATALAASINATTTATTSAVSQLLLPLNRFVYARVKPGGGGNDSIVQVMCRIAGADLNYPANSTARVTNTFNNSAMTSPLDFTGGADGPFGYLLNTASVFGKSDGQTGTAGPAYGLFFAASPGPSEPGASDVVHVRTRRSGGDYSVTWNTNGTASANWRSRNYLFDNGTVWSGDNGKVTVAFKNSNGSSTGSNFYLTGSSTLTFASHGNGNFEIQMAVTASGSGSFNLVSLASAARVAFKRCRFVEASDNLKFISFSTDNGSSIGGYFVDLSDSFVQYRGSVASKPLVSVVASSTSGVRVVLNGLTVEVVAASAAIGKFIDLTTAGSTGSVEWVGGEVRDSLGVYRCPMPYNIHASAVYDALIDGVVGVTDPSVGMTASTTSAARFRWNSPEGPNKGFRNETPRYSVDWKGDGTFPYAGAAADMRGVNWSHRITWGAMPSAFASAMVLKLSRFYRSSAAARTITVELYLPTATTVYDDELEVAVTYIDSGGVPRTEPMGGARGQQFSSSRTALSSSSASWTANGVASYSAKKIELITANAIKQDSEITVRLSLCASRGSALTAYVSPELGVA